MSRGHIERLKSGTYRVVVYAGKDPITGRKTYFKETHPTENAAHVAAERLLAQVGSDRTPDRATLAYLLDRWMEVVDHELTTAETSAGYIRRTLKPALGEMPLRKLQHRVDIIDRLYTHLRRCNQLCDGTVRVDHKAVGEHDCAQRKCARHVCQPMSPGAVRRVHAILSGALNYAVSWGWIERNPAEYAHPPKLARRRAQPPAGDHVARLINAAWTHDTELAVFLWLAATTGARRGELVALRWSNIDLEQGLLRVASNYVVRQNQQRLKGTKTGEERLLSLDSVTVPLLDGFRAARQAALIPARKLLPEDAFLFSSDPLGAWPWHPDHFTHAYRALADELGIAEPLKNLRHFNATQLLAAGVDLPTTASRLGHSDGGATTLRVYASHTRPADQRAAELVAGGLDALRRSAAVDAGADRAHRAMARTSWPVADVLPAVLPGTVGSYLDVAAGLRSAIASGRLGVGDTVPTVTELAAHYGVARSTAQRAVSLVGQKGRIVRAGHRWVVVEEQSAPVVSSDAAGSTPSAPAV